MHMKNKKRYVATFDEVSITRDGETAIIKYKETDIGETNLTIGPAIYNMSDQDILNLHNDMLLDQTELIKNYQYIATEIPPGKPQTEYFKPGGYWTPRGDVLRCEITSQDDGEAAILIDDKEFSMYEFGKLLSLYEGWGMRIIFVPEDEICQAPRIEIKDPDRKGSGSISIAPDFISRQDH